MHSSLKRDAELSLWLLHLGLLNTDRQQCADASVSAPRKATKFNFLINDHACLVFIEFFSTTLLIFQVINVKICLLTFIFHLINEKIFPPYSFILVCSFISEIRVCLTLLQPDAQQRMALVDGISNWVYYII